MSSGTAPLSTGRGGTLKSLYSSLKRTWRRSTKKQRQVDRFLKRCKGVIHVGANTGQERKLYDLYDLNVLWIEPIPSVFAELQQNIAKFPKQRAVEALVTDRDGDVRVLNISNNSGLSSSILDLDQHKDIWPHVKYVSALECTTRTLPSILAAPPLNSIAYDALVMDTQGSELLVLKGATSLLGKLSYIKTEAADFELYAGSAKLSELQSFLKDHGFELAHLDKFAERAEGGACYDALFQKISLARS